MIDSKIEIEVMQTKVLNISPTKDGKPSPASWKFDSANWSIQDGGVLIGEAKAYGREFHITGGPALGNTIVKVSCVIAPSVSGTMAPYVATCAIKVVAPTFDGVEIVETK